MAASGNGRGGDDRGQLAEAFHFLLSNDPPVHSPESPYGRVPAPTPGTDDLQRLLSTARQNEGSEVELRQRLSGSSGSKGGQKEIEASQKAMVILDADCRVRCVSAGARRLLALSPKANDQIFNYFLQPGRPMLIHIERLDRTAGVGRLVAVRTRWEGQAAYLVTVQDVTHRERDRVAG